MFATLDPTVRLLPLPSKRQALLSDTVGFIRNLPATLVQAFRATLEEVKEATLILHVVDSSSEHAREHAAHVLEVLEEIDAGGTPQMLVLNKADRLSPEQRADAAGLSERIIGHHAGGEPAGQQDAPAQAIRSALVSAQTGEGIDRLLTLIDSVLAFDTVRTERFRIPLSNGSDIALLHRAARVIREEYDEISCFIEAEAAESIRRRLGRYVVNTNPLRD
jgi:GTP-binding protein HflX